MAIFHQTITGRHPDLEFCFPLQDEEGNIYNNEEEAKTAFLTGQRLFHVHNLTSGVVILERHLEGDDDWLLVSSHEDVKEDLLTAAAALSYRESVVLEGMPLVCQGRSVRVFGGFGKNLHGKTWACLEVNTHQPPHGDLLSALLLKGVIRNDGAEEWSKGPPPDCDGNHLYHYF